MSTTTRVFLVSGVFARLADQDASLVASTVLRCVSLVPPGLVSKSVSRTGT